ncbi:zinc finger protein CONSTANS-LIKE 1-like [Hibiscus syriacus]|uniref:zinc finger protein CONSTANS-LIKE 1-like n=1 Tax=Hibiscus syriacus TaxID=106335 RepID=UPI0019227C9D|nr:zinc finger protein CONSTANS-LIKE 1-like [Hibiscus syriacus]XP_039014541.1 zinc finger protein CONSTANS-LIKE 1-like [Hibiscus syriacus]
MKSCELCDLAASTYCESDLASLCWGCDAKVHGANFLVARHVRCLICHACHSLTPWRAAGSKLGHTVSVCERCVNGGDREGSEPEIEEDERVVYDDDAEEDGDNQVVLSSTASNTPPPASSSSTSEEYSDGGREVCKSTNLFPLKRSRENFPDLRYQDELDPLYPKRRYGYRTVLSTPCRAEDESIDEAVSVDSIRMPKEQLIKQDDAVHLQSDSCDSIDTASA